MNTPLDIVDMVSELENVFLVQTFTREDDMIIVIVFEFYAGICAITGVRRNNLYEGIYHWFDNKNSANMEKAYEEHYSSLMSLLELMGYKLAFIEEKHVKHLSPIFRKIKEAIEASDIPVKNMILSELNKIKV